MQNYIKLTNAQGYYCAMCDSYHEIGNIKHRYTIETLGEWNGENATIIAHEMECPTCRHDDEWEKFNYMNWSHLRAFQEATKIPMIFRYPLFDRATNGETYDHEQTTSAEKIEEIADWYCIEIVKVELIEGTITVTVDFQ